VSLNEVTLTLDAYNGQQVPVGAGTAFLTPTAAVSFPTDSVWLWAVPVEVSLVPPSGAASGWLPTVTLVACDNAGANPSSWGWVLTLQAGPGAPPGFTFSLDFSAGAQQNLSAQVPAQVGTALYDYLPQPSGTPEVGDVPVYVGPGQATAWGNPGDASLFLLKTGGTITGSLVVDDELSTSNNVLDDGSGNLTVAGTVTVGGVALGSAAFQPTSAFDEAGAAEAVETYANETFLPLAGGTLTGGLTVDGQTILGVTQIFGGLNMENTGISGAASLTLSKAASTGGILSVTNTTSAPSAPSVQLISETAGDELLGFQVTGDTQPRLYIDSYGSMHWGSGTAAADTNLSRNSAGNLQTGGLFVSGSRSGGALFTVTNTHTAPTSPTAEFIAAASGDTTLGIQVSGDTTYRFTSDSNGSLQWGPGGSAAQDITLYRASTATLQLSSHFIAQASSTVSPILKVVNADGSPSAPISAIVATSSGDLSFGIEVSGDADYRFTIDSNGLHSWGSGSAVADVTLSRGAIGTLSLSGALSLSTAQSGGVVRVTNTQGTPTDPSVWVVAHAAGDSSYGVQVSGDSYQRFYIDSNGMHSWGPGGTTATDTTLYRSATNTLNTGGALVAGGYMKASSFQASEAAGSGGVLSITNTSTPSGAATAEFIAHASADAVVGIEVTGDSYNRLIVDSNGQLKWGSGAAAADTTLARTAADTLTLGNNLIVNGVLSVYSAVEAYASKTAGGIIQVQNSTSAPTSPNSTIQSAASGDLAFGLDVASDADMRFTIDSNGKHQWGTGAGAVDTTLYRQGIGALQTNSFRAVNYAGAGEVLLVQNTYSGTPTAPNVQFIAANAGDPELGILVSGDTDYRFQIDSNGKHQWGPGGTTATDTALFRESAGVVQTGGSLAAQYFVQPGNGSGLGGHLYSGSGVPNIAGGVSGDVYFRTDTPTTPSQQIYVGTGSNTWTPLGTGIGLLATTGTAGFALQNATATILSWTAPNDGNLHRVIIYASMEVTSTETGGLIQVAFTPPGGTVGDFQLFASGQNTGARVPSAFNLIIGAGTTIAIDQNSALTAGAAVMYAEIWGS
jgi:hypothetical protein